MDNAGGKEVFVNALRDRTKNFVLRSIRLFRSLPGLFPEMKNPGLSGVSFFGLLLPLVRIIVQHADPGVKESFIPNLALLSKKPTNPFSGWKSSRKPN
jgi:hypothetical protein